MKKYHKIAAVCFIPFFIGVVLFMIGAVIPDFTVAEIGKIMMIGGMAFGCIAYGIAYVVYINVRKRGAGFNTPTREDIPGADKQLPGERRVSEDQYSAATGNTVTPHDPELPPTLRGKVLWGIWAVLMVAGFAFLFISIMLEDKQLIIISASVFFAAVIATAAGKLISERVSLNFDKDKSHYSEIADGIVRSCTTSSSVQVGGRTVRTVYQVVVNVKDRDYLAYSREQYSFGESVTVAIRGRDRAFILDRTQNTDSQNM